MEGAWSGGLPVAIFIDMSAEGGEEGGGLLQDVAVATFLMLLWRDMYPLIDHDPNVRAAGESWSTWGRPAGGFVDLGCVSGDRVRGVVQAGEVADDDV